MPRVSTRHRRRHSKLTEDHQDMLHHWKMLSSPEHPLCNGKFHRNLGLLQILVWIQKIDITNHYYKGIHWQGRRILAFRELTVCLHHRRAVDHVCPKTLLKAQSSFFVLRGFKIQSFLGCQKKETTNFQNPSASNKRKREALFGFLGTLILLYFPN